MEPVPASYRVTPEALAHYAARRPGPRFSAGGFVRGGLVAWLAFPVAALGPAARGMTSEEMRGLPAVVVPVLALSLPFVVCVALPLAVGLALGLRRVSGQWWHVAAFAGLGGAVGAVGLLIWGLATPSTILAASSAATVGRIAMWRHHDPSPGS